MSSPLEQTATCAVPYSPMAGSKPPMSLHSHGFSVDIKVDTSKALAAMRRLGKQTRKMTPLFRRLGDEMARELERDILARILSYGGEPIMAPDYGCSLFLAV